MVQKPKTFQAYQAEMLAALSKTGIRQLAPGGKARAIGDTLCDMLSSQEARQFQNLAERTLPFATGVNLDHIGEVYGITRIPQRTATVEAGERNFRFYVRQGTFGAINAGRSIEIPAGVRIFTQNDNGPVFLTTALTLNPGDSEQYFSASALSPGSANNAAAGIFSRHNFTAYSESRYGSLLVSNSYGIVGGRDEEDDESLRYRIYQHIRGRSMSNEAALRSELLTIPGIQDVVFDRHAGSYTCYVYAITPVASAGLLADVQAVLAERSVFPFGSAVSPDLVGISLATTVRLSGAASASDKDRIASSARQAAEEYLFNLRIGEPLIINEIADRIRNADVRILDVGEPNRQLPELLIWRSRADGTRYSRFLVNNYQPALGERVVVEDRPNAIAISVS